MRDQISKVRRTFPRRVRPRVTTKRAFGIDDGMCQSLTYPMRCRCALQIRRDRATLDWSWCRSFHSLSVRVNRANRDEGSADARARSAHTQCQNPSRCPPPAVRTWGSGSSPSAVAHVPEVVNRVMGQVEGKGGHRELAPVGPEAPVFPLRSCHACKPGREGLRRLSQLL